MKKAASILLAMLLLFSVTACGADNTSANAVAEVEVKQNEKVILSLYFPNRETSQLTLEKRFVDKALMEKKEDQVNTVLEELKKGPLTDTLVNPIPQQGTMQVASVKNKTVTIDFDKAFVDAHGGGSSGEYATIYAIVNSLTALDGIEKVEFTVDGKKTDQFKGHLDIASVFKPTDDVDE